MTRLVTATRDIELRDGDLLVIETAQVLTQEQAKAIRDQVLKATGLHAVILTGGLRLAAVRDDPGTPIYDALVAGQ